MKKGLKVDVIGPENRLSGGTSLHISAQKLQAGAVKGLTATHVLFQPYTADWIGGDTAS